MPDSGRLVRRELPTGEIAIQPPPVLDTADSSGGVLTNAIPMLGSLGSVVAVATMGGASSGVQSRSLLAAGIFCVATVAFLLVQLERQRTRRAQLVTGSRVGYLHHLGVVRATVRDAAAQQRAALLWQHPEPGALPAVAQERSRVWSYAVSDPLFLRVRYAVSTQPLSRELVPVAPDRVDRVDPAAASARHRLVAVHRVQRGLPATLDLRETTHIQVCGPGPETRALARAIICSAATFQSPDDVAIAVVTTDGSLAEWDWVKWLPHAWSPRAADAAGPRRMVAADLGDLVPLLPTDRHVLVIVDPEVSPAGGPELSVAAPGGVTVLDLTTRWHQRQDSGSLRLMVQRDDTPGAASPAISALRIGQPPESAIADQCDLATAEAVARRLTALPCRTTGAETPDAGVRGAGRARAPDFLDLVGLHDLSGLDPAVSWRHRSPGDRLRIPIGTGEGGEVVHLDLKESAQQGMGPHGLVIGATGSGKSELLRTLVLGLAITHSPEQLNLVLVDFKGGATFAGMSSLPHVSAVITNLEHELDLVGRMEEALSGEMLRRQELLRDAGNYASVVDYERARSAGQCLAPLPSLLVVVDEFSELLSAKPELLELFGAIGRLGRSLGLHLLLASQRLEEGRLRGLESHLSYRIGLRTFSAQESRVVLGVPDAYELPPTPGLGFLKPGRSTLVRFEAAYVSGPATSPRRQVATTAGSPKARDVLPWVVTQVHATAASEPATQPAPPSEPASAGPASLLDVAVGRLHGSGPPARRIWLPPLDVPETLDRLMPDLAVDRRLGLISHRWRAERGGLTIPLGSTDRPREQRRDTLTADLSGAGGHVAVVGGPRAGKSTLLRTLVTSLSLTTTPLESQFFVLDFGGGAFAALRGLPHVSGVGTRSEPDVVRRIVAEVTGVVDRREGYFRAEGIDSAETYRTRRARGEADDGYGDVFLVVDGWSSLRSEFDDLEVELQRLAARGLTFGFHLLSASTRWADYRAAIRDLIGTRLELRLGDPLDSEIDRKLAALVPRGRSGRGIVPERLHVLSALPRLDGDPDPSTLGEGIETTVRQIAQAWTGPTGPKLRLLPGRIDLGQVIDQAARAAGAHRRTPSRHLLLGVDERELAPVGLDADSDPHWLIFGESGSGKTAALRTYLREVTRTRTPAQAQVVLVDYRRSLSGEVPADYLLDQVGSAADAAPVLAGIAHHLERRLPSSDVTPEELRSRSWWTGPDVHVVVDDYDLVATSHGSPLQALHPLLAHARDIGLHLAVARRSGGAGRALHEPVIQSLRDLAVPGLLLAGSPDEGPLIGATRPTPAEPGRGRLVTRGRGVEVVQVAWCEAAC